MGLDQYLYARKYFSGFSEPENCAALMKIANIESSAEHFHAYLDFVVGYWRKSNQIHNWFVSNVQNGSDDCEKYPVTIEQLKELKNICLNILKIEDPKKRIKEASNKLETKSGFFFGSTSYDEDYFEDISRTVVMIDKIEKGVGKDQDITLYYQSSW